MVFSCTLIIRDYRVVGVIREPSRSFLMDGKMAAANCGSNGRGKAFLSRLLKEAQWEAPSLEQMAWMGTTPRLYEAAKKRLANLQFPLVLYRAIKISSEDELWHEQVGIYWTDQLDKARFYTPAGKKAKGEKYVLRTTVKAHMIDWDATFNANCEPQGNTGTREQEIKLHRGAPLVIDGLMVPGETVFQPRQLQVKANSKGTAE
jgi:hypothetical protein